MHHGDIKNNLLVLDGHRGRVVRTARLWCRKSLDSHEFDPGLGHPTIGNLLCGLSMEMCTCFN